MNEEERIKRFQDNLLLIRKAVGWSEEELGNRIGVTRQTINNLESKKKKSKLTKTQYIAMRAVLNEEIINSEEDSEMLICLLEILVDHPEKYTEEDKIKILEKANMLVPAIMTKANSRKEVSKEFKAILEAVGVGIGIIISAGIAGMFFKGKK